MKVLISDYHAGCQLWQHALLTELGHTAVINSFSGHQFLIEDAKKQDLTPRSKQLIPVYNIQPVVESVGEFDTAVISFPPKAIDLYKTTTFKKPTILNCGHRLHIHTRQDPTFVKDLVERVKRNEIILCSMSKYDTEYIRHYTGITPIQLEVACFHLPRDLIYKPTRKEILISPVHASSVLPFASVAQMNSMAGGELKFSNVKDLYPKYTYYDLMNHSACVLFPYSVFAISMIELYESNIPMFVPTKRLLLETGLMNDVSVYPLYGPLEEMKRIDTPHPDSPHRFSPNSLQQEDKEYWLQYAYFNTKENIIYWDSPADLFAKLKSTNLQAVSDCMKIENDRHRATQLENWKIVLAMLGK
jgi:hypothetical protein